MKTLDSLLIFLKSADKRHKQAHIIIHADEHHGRQLRIDDADGHAQQNERKNDGEYQ